MTSKGLKKLLALLREHEGFSSTVYEDTRGYATIGFGRNVKTKGISRVEANYLLENDVEYFLDRLTSRLKCFNELDEVRKIVLVSMCFNLGYYGLCSFEKMLHAIALEMYDVASFEMLNSKWAKQVKGRAKELAQMMATGEMPHD